MLDTTYFKTNLSVAISVARVSVKRTYCVLYRTGFATLVMGIAVIGCSDLSGNQPLPAGTSDPAIYATPEGARGMRNAAVYQFEAALPQFITESGLITDELQDRATGASTGTLLQHTDVRDALDERILAEQLSGGISDATGGFRASTNIDGSLSYNNLQGFRELANQAIGALTAYDTLPADTVSVRILKSELYAFEGYAEIMLADLFCSGIPLSTLDFERNYTLHAGSSTVQVYQDALAKLDTAYRLATGNDSLTNLVRVGRGRVWLDLGQYDSAAVAVSSVPTGFKYQVAGAWYTFGGDQGSAVNVLMQVATVSDREGMNGLPYISSGDPRSTVMPVTFQGVNQEFPTGYKTSLSGVSSPIIVADGIEARLIEAEVALHAGDVSTWLSDLNQLRAQWSAGTGEAVTLAPLTDPGTTTGRIALLFQERAYWLFLTGHRQGDLRRLIRNYASIDPNVRSQSLVYPTGPYTAPGRGVYGSDVTAPIPYTEYTNPLFHGCQSREP
jgi:hypothetical protein